MTVRRNLASRPCSTAADCSIAADSRRTCVSEGTGISNRAHSAICSSPEKYFPATKRRALYLKSWSWIHFKKELSSLAKAVSFLSGEGFPSSVSADQKPPDFI